MVDLTAMSTLDNGLALYLDSGGGLVAPNMAELTGNVSVLSGSSLTLPDATSVVDMTLNVNGTLSLPVLTTVSNVTVNLAESGVLTLPELLSTSDSNITLSGSSLFDSPKLTGMTVVWGTVLASSA